MKYALLALGLALTACSGDRGVDPPPPDHTLEGRHLVTVAPFVNRAPTADGAHIVQIEEIARWHFVDGRYRFEVQTVRIVTELQGFVALAYSLQRPRTVYEGNYWLTMGTERRGVLHLERTGGTAYSRLDGTAIELTPTNTELPVLFGEVVVTISETDYIDAE